MSNKIILITYGDDAYRNQREAFKRSAIESRFFNQINIYTPEDIDQEFKQKFDHVLRRHRGGGYWIWKPYVVKKALSECKKNDIIIYADAGCLINKNGEEKLKEYISILNQSKTGSVAFSSNHQEIKYTNKKVLDFFDADDVMKSNDQLMATAFLLKKCDHSVFLIDKWYAALFDDPELFTDLYNSEPQDRQFIDHRHDQSVFSLIRKIWGSEIITKDETYFDDFTNEGKRYPIWARRFKDRNY